MASERVPGCQVCELLLIHPENHCKLFDIFGGRLRLPVEDGGDCNFIAADGFGDVGERETLFEFGVKEGLGLDRKTGC